MKSIDELVKEFQQEILHLPEKHKTGALEVFGESYSEHKRLNGSFSLLTGEDYAVKMRERQRYQISKVKEYVRRVSE